MLNMITPEEVKSKTPPLFSRKIKFGELDECWLWQNTKHGQGYGQYSFKQRGVKKTHKAHRFLYECLFGEIENLKLEVRHFVCDNTTCCNPNHLKLGTHKENMEDRENKGRGRPPDNRGSKNGMSKLTEADVVIIRKRVAKGEKQIVVAKDYGIASGVISNIVNRKWWKHVK